MSVARSATAPELALFRNGGQWSKVRAAVLVPHTIYTARINQTFSTLDKVLEITYDTGSGTLANISPDMTLLIGSTAGAWDIGIVRIRSADATKFYIAATSDVEFANDLYLTVVDDFGLWARPILISGAVPYFDGGIVYSNQHSVPDPTPIMGGHRVLKLEGATVSAQFDSSGSYVIDGSAIASYEWSAPTASGITGSTTSTPTIEFDAVGWHTVYMAVTAANGKSFTGVRYVYIWNDANPPASAEIGECRCNSGTGGWEFSLTLHEDADTSSIRDHALVLLFGEDFYEDDYGTVQQSIGQVTGSENIYAMGWIAKETILWSPEQGKVQFTVYGAHFWMSIISAWPDGVELVTGIPAAWTSFQALTVDKGVWHFLHWRSTATRVMDVFLTGNTLYTKEVSSLAPNLWEQLQEMAFSQIYARAGVNAQGQLFLEIHPQLVPEADRSWASVMTITKEDLSGEIDLERITINEVTQVSLSGVIIDISGNGVAVFSLSAGHEYTHYGQVDIQDRLLVASQVQANSQAGLYFGFRNNPYPDIPLEFCAHNRLIDCFPRQKCSITIAAGDTPRGISYSGYIIPNEVSIVQDAETGYVHTEAHFEAASVEALSTNGDIPEADDISVPPKLPKLPPLPPYVSIYPGDVSSAPDGPPVVILLDDTKGILYSENFNAAGSDVIWQFGNAGIDAADIPNITDFYITPSGAVWVIVHPYTIYYASRRGALFTKVVDFDWLVAEYPNSQFDVASGGDRFIAGFGVNPNQPEQVAFIAGGHNFPAFTADVNFWIGTHAGFTKKVACTNVNTTFGHLTFGGNQWVLLNEQFTFFAFWDSRLWRFSADGSAIDFEVAIDSGGGSVVQRMSRVGTSPSFYYWNIFGDIMYRTADNGTLFVLTGDSNQSGTDIGAYAVDLTGQYLLGVWDTGQRGKSSDFGTTWSGLPTLPFGGQYAFAYAGGVGVSSRWIAARGVIRYANDAFGAGTWQNKEGNIGYLIPVGMAIRKIIVPGYNYG